MPQVPPSGSEWFEGVVARCQVFIGERTPAEFDIVDVASTFVRDLPDARCHGEDLLLRALLLDVADCWGASLHEDLHRRANPTSCGFDAISRLRPFLKGAHETRSSVFWRGPDTSAPSSIGSIQFLPRVARRRSSGNTPARLTPEPSRPCWGVSPRQLRRAFRQTFGVPLPEYLRRTRLLRALEVMAAQPGKVEPVALDVGYRSKKDFYRVFRQFIGMTPTAFMRLPPDSARGLIDRTRLALIPQEPLPNVKPRSDPARPVVKVHSRHFVGP